MRIFDILVLLGLFANVVFTAVFMHEQNALFFDYVGLFGSVAFGFYLKEMSQYWGYG